MSVVWGAFIGIEDIMMILLSHTFSIMVLHLLGGPRLLPRTPSGSTSSFTWTQLLQAVSASDSGPLPGSGIWS